MILGLRRRLVLSTVVLLAVSVVIAGAAEEPSPASLWLDFNHYVRIARPDLAQAAANTLLKTVKPQELLDIVEAARDYQDYDLTFQRASKIERLRDVSDSLAQTIQNAKITRSREPQRIKADIQKLLEGKRANRNATERLKAAGQFAAPYLLAVLLDEDQQKLHSPVLTAMVAVGRPLVYPLSTSLSHLEPVPLGQVSQVLADIGYPEALPYLQEVLQTSRANPVTLSVVQSAYDRLLSRTHRGSGSSSATAMYLDLGWRQYEAGTNSTNLPGLDPSTRAGVIWDYDREAGLIAITVPEEIYCDVLAMRSAAQSLRLNPQQDTALNLWLLANLRRENRLPRDAKDRSYSSSMHDPAFYIRMAGPLRQHDVLTRALDDSDTDLALDAIAALSETAGATALINTEGASQPLLRALGYPDRRVRFNAAFGIARAQPTVSFPGSDLVVPVLAEAVRQSAANVAVVLSNNTDTLNKLTATVKDLGYQPIPGLRLDDVTGQINASAGIDLIVVQQNAADTESVYHQTATDYRLAMVPILAIVSPGGRTELEDRLPNNKRLFYAQNSDEKEALKTAFSQAIQANHGAIISPEESARIASTALALLRQMTSLHSGVFNTADAMPTLVRSLSDPRLQIASRAARVLAVIDEQPAQQAVAEAAFDPARPVALRITLLESLAESARVHGNYLTERQLESLLNIVKTSRGEVADAAAQAHGALTLPTANAVQMIVQ